jgi:hypothetical protein
MRQGLAPSRAPNQSNACAQAAEAKRARAGITLLELVFAVVLVGILGQVRDGEAGFTLTLTLPTQAQSLADVIAGRRAWRWCAGNA